jgi:hypothetical protein
LAQRKTGQCRSPVTSLHSHGKYGGCLLFGEKISKWFSSAGVLDTSMLLLAAFVYEQKPRINVLAPVSVMCFPSPDLHIRPGMHYEGKGILNVAQESYLIQIWLFMHILDEVHHPETFLAT